MSEEKKDRIPLTMVGEVYTPCSQTTAYQHAILPSTGEEADHKEQPSNAPQNQPKPAANDKGERKP